MTLDKKWFYEQLKPFGANKYTPIYIDMPLNKNDTRYRLIFDWSPLKPNGEFNKMMSAQLIDTHKTVSTGKYIVPDLWFDCIKENVTTDYKLYKYLKQWIDTAFKNIENKGA